MKVKIWGTRGSLPAPLAPKELTHKIKWVLRDFFSKKQKKKSEVAKYLKSIPAHHWRGFGGNTICVSFHCGEEMVVIDGGTGLKDLGVQLMAGACGQGRGEVHLFFTHFHWDHLIGLPFFTPIFIPGNRIHVYAVQKDLKKVFTVLFQKPFFPVPFQKLGAHVIFHQLTPRRKKQHGVFAFTPYQLDHSDPCWGYRIEANGKSVAHCVDTEAIRTTEEELGKDLSLYQNADLMIFDAQYTLLKTIEKVNWGHAAASYGMDIALREKIKKVVFTHHDPYSSDVDIWQAQKEAARYFQYLKKMAKRNQEPMPALEWSFAYDGLEIEL